jgi:LCP family protein required for cell wall assembly
MKKVIFFIEMLVIVILIAVIIVMFVPGAKMKAAKAFLGCSIGKSITSCMIGDDYEAYIQDDDYHESSFEVNEGLEIPDEYTNIALFGGDANGDSENGFLGEGAHSDSIIILSINNKTGEMKMVSVYRDTYLEYTVEEENYGKATNAMYFGGIDSAVNMLNKNLDLNIKDYIVINYSGLANIIDSLGGITVTISQEEMFFINGHLVDTRAKTGLDTPDVETFGEVQLTGLQAVAYCRIRQTTFTDSEGVQYNDDYGRTERQKHILKLTLQKVKDSGISDLLDISKTLFKENTEENKFISTSLDLDEALEMLSVALDMNITGTSGFPTERGSKNMSGGLSIIPKTLETNVGILHNYLFGTEDYEVTDTVQEINDTIVRNTGIQ